MAGLTLKGKVDKINETQVISDTFSKRELWLEIDRETEYPQTVKVEFVKDKCDMISKFKIGDEVEIDVNIRGNKGIIKKTGLEECFNSLNGWRIRGVASGGNDAPSADDNGTDDNGTDDLPF